MYHLRLEGHLSRAKLLRDIVELQRDRHQTLQQRVVNFSTHARPLGEHEIELPLDVPHVPSPREPQQHSQQRHRERIEHLGLVERRQERHRQRSTGLEPRPIVIRSDAERVVPGR